MGKINHKLLLTNKAFGNIDTQEMVLVAAGEMMIVMGKQKVIFENDNGKRNNKRLYFSDYSKTTIVFSMFQEFLITFMMH